jgi:glycosyltransferase involved in cell wall biosynthesis
VPTIGGSASLCLPTCVKDVLFMNAGIQGCALMFNAALRSICRNVPKVVAMHDHVVTLAAATFGTLTYVDRHLMLYRRHEKAVTGPTAKHLTDRIAPFFDSTKTVLDKKHYAAIQSFMETYNSLISDKDKAIFFDFLRFEKEGRIRRALHVFAKGYKLYDEFSKAARKVKKLYPETQFELLGSMDPSYPKSVPEERLHQDEADGILKYVGFTHDMNSVYERKGIVITLPSYSEGMNRALMEATASGKPIITSDIPGCREAVDDGVNGYLVPVKNADALAEAMLRYIRLSDEEKQKQSDMSRVKAESIFDIRNVIGKYKEIVGE